MISLTDYFHTHSKSLQTWYLHSHMERVWSSLHYLERCPQDPDLQEEVSPEGQREHRTQSK